MPRALEVAQWVGQRGDEGRPPVSISLNEPVLSPGTDTVVPPGYKITEPNIDNAVATNPHLNTAIIYQLDPERVSTSEEVGIMQQRDSSEAGRALHHKGMTAIEVYTTDMPYPSIVQVTLYMPNPSAANPPAYSQSLAENFVELANRAQEGGLALIAFFDSNCAFKEKGVYPPSRNTEIVRRIISTAGVRGGPRMVVMNWEDETANFYTRMRQGQRPSGLDLALVSQNIAADCHLEIGDTPSFASDHCLLWLTVGDDTAPKAEEVRRDTKVFTWTADNKSAYANGMIAELTAFIGGAELTLRRGEELSQDRETVGGTVDKLTAIAVKSRDEHVSHTTRTTPWRRRRTPGENSVASVEIRARDTALAAMLEADEAGASREQKRALKARYDKSVSTVRRVFAMHTKEKLTAQWAKMEHSYHKNKKECFETFSQALGKKHVSLPRTLRVNGSEVRRPHAIKKWWAERFKVEEIQTGTQEDKDWRDGIVALNKQRARTSRVEKTHASAMYNAPFVHKEVGAALARADNDKKEGDDTLSNEMLRWGGELMLVALLLVMNIMLAAEVIPHSWKRAPIAPAYKKKDRRVRANYRPLTFLSNVYKLYERMLDARMRATVHIDWAQCGFRPRSGPLFTLTRAQAAMQYCKQRGINLYMAFIDFSQAFERVWREGLLWRLWEAGVRGKVWRIVRDMLTGTKQYVLTNYGDTDDWDTTVGIVQGSVLSAFLFIIFITPMSEELAHLSARINNMRVPPQLFADDGTLYAIGACAMAALALGCMEWSAKWMMIVSMVKSQIVALLREAPQVFADPEMIQVVAHAVCLGVGVSDRGVFSLKFLRQLLRRLVMRITAIMEAGVQLGSLRTDVGMHLYVALAQSIIKYALPLTPRDRGHIKELDAEQTRFANRFLSFPETAPDHAAKAELGLLDYDLMAARATLLLHHRIDSSPDPITREMVTWGPGGGVRALRETCMEELGRLLPELEWSAFTNLPYKLASLRLKEAARNLQTRRWVGEEKVLGYETAYVSKSKPGWGMEESLLCLQPNKVSVYLRARNGVGLEGHTDESGACKKCGTHVQWAMHLMIECQGTQMLRDRFDTETGRTDPRLGAMVRALGVESKFHFLMGAGAATMSAQAWQHFQTRAVDLVFQVYEEW